MTTPLTISGGIFTGISGLLINTSHITSGLVSGIVAILFLAAALWSYFHKNITPAPKRFQKPKNAPISQGSLSVYCKTSERLLSIARELAEKRSLEFVDMDTDFVYLLEKLKYFEIQTISALDSLVYKYEKESILLSNYLTPKSGVSTGFFIDLTLEIHAIETGGLEKLSDFLNSLKHSSSDRGFIEELYSSYMHIKEYGT